MKKNFKNFLILTLIVAVISTVLIELMFMYIGNYAWFIIAAMAFISLMMIILENKPKPKLRNTYKIKK